MIVDTYFGGDYNCWSYGYPWMLRYLDERYKDIAGHQGLTRFVADFPRFHRAIEGARSRPWTKLDGGALASVDEVWPKVWGILLVVA
jgi:hypothetical protein